MAYIQPPCIVHSHPSPPPPRPPIMGVAGKRIYLWDNNSSSSCAQDISHSSKSCKPSSNRDCFSIPNPNSTIFQQRKLPTGQRMPHCLPYIYLCNLLFFLHVYRYFQGLRREGLLRYCHIQGLIRIQRQKLRQNAKRISGRTRRRRIFL